MLPLEDVDGARVLADPEEIVGWKTHDAKQNKPDDKRMCNKHDRLSVMLCRKLFHGADGVPPNAL
jgi:hypothetical protein